MSEDDKWDSENFRAQSRASPMGLISNKWDGEDEEEDIKDSWDDPEEEESDDKKDEDISGVVKAIQVKKPKKLLAKIEEKERKLAQKVTEMTPEEVQAEKMRRQQLQEQADLEVAKQLLGVSIKTESPALDTKEDFEKFSEDIVRHISSASKNQNFFGFVEHIVQQLCVHLTPNELKKIHTWVGNLQIEKTKMEQGTKSKKKGKGKAKLTLDNDTDIYSTYTEDLYDDFM